jgi:hypothetical protein
LLALLAITLQGLWPLLAQARPAMSVPICSSETPGHSIEIPVGKSATGGEHCKLCVVATDVAVVAPEFSFALPEGFFEQKSERGKESLAGQPFPQARPRAPPVSS